MDGGFVGLLDFVGYPVGGGIPATVRQKAGGAGGDPRKQMWRMVAVEYARSILDRQDHGQQERIHRLEIRRMEYQAAAALQKKMQEWTMYAVMFTEL